MKRDVYAIIVDNDGESVICILDCLERANEILEKMKPYPPVFIKKFLIDLDNNTIFVLYEEYINDDQKGNEKIILKLVLTKNEALHCSSLSTDCLLECEEHTLNDTAKLFKGKYKHFLKDPPKRDPLIDEDYILYVKEMQEKYSTYLS